MCTVLYEELLDDDAAAAKTSRLLYRRKKRKIVYLRTKWEEASSSFDVKIVPLLVTQTTNTIKSLGTVARWCSRLAGLARFSVMDSRQNVLSMIYSIFFSSPSFHFLLFYFYWNTSLVDLVYILKIKNYFCFRLLFSLTLYTFSWYKYIFSRPLYLSSCSLLPAARIRLFRPKRIK